jgi:hypothetical protein
LLGTAINSNLFAVRTTRPTPTLVSAREQKSQFNLKELVRPRRRKSFLSLDTPGDSVSGNGETTEKREAIRL